MKQKFYLSPTRKKRVIEIDFLRGFAVLLMILDHMMFDFMDYPSWVSNFNQVDNGVFNALNNFGTMIFTSSWRLAGHYIFASLFILISGISSTFSHSNLERGLKLSFVAIMLTLVTHTIQTTIGLEIGIYMGILHVLATAIILYGLVDLLVDNKWVDLAMAIIFAVLTYFIVDWNARYISPDLIMENFKDFLLGRVISGADYIHLLPTIGLMFFGSFIGKTVYAKKKSLVAFRHTEWTKPVIFLGKHALAIYVLHQVIIASILFLVGYLVGYRL